MGEADRDPTTIRSLAISPEDTVDAFVYGRENPGEGVLRITPPFHGRMRARIHVYHVDDAPVTGAIHVAPADVIEDDVVDAYPTLEDELEDADPAETERIRERHADAVDEWRATARTALVDSVTLETAAGTHRVDVKPLG